MIRILIADDHSIVREGIKKLFTKSEDIVVAGEASTGEQVLDILSAGGIDLLLLDMSMPGLSGEDLIKRICLLDNAPPILVLSMHNEPQIALSAITAGAAGYLTKDSDHEVIGTAIRKVASGGRFIDSDVAEKLAFEGGSAKPILLHKCLSERQMLIFRMIVRGQSLNAIAIDLGISNKTVSVHKANLMKRMGFTSNAELIRYAIASDIELDPIS
jgi:DNA-binding NarL/FixJ family response regulator